MRSKVGLQVQNHEYNIYQLALIKFSKNKSRKWTFNFHDQMPKSINSSGFTILSRKVFMSRRTVTKNKIFQLRFLTSSWSLNYKHYSANDSWRMNRLSVYHTALPIVAPRRVMELAGYWYIIVYSDVRRQRKREHYNVLLFSVLYFASNLGLRKIFLLLFHKSEL